MPRTRPRASSSGPPELPWLIAASVWIAPTVAKPVSDWIGGAGAETPPTHSDRHGLLPAERTAYRGDRRADGGVARRAERQRAQGEAGGLNLEQRDVGERVEAADAGRAPVL